MIDELWFEVVSNLAGKIVALNRIEGDDLLSDVTLVCWEKRMEYDWTDPRIAGRVMMIAKNINANWHRNRIRQQETERVYPVQTTTEHRQNRRLNPSSRFTFLNRLSLTKEERTIVEENIIHDRPLCEIAKRLGQNTSTLRSKKRRLLSKLARSNDVYDVLAGRARVSWT